MRIPAAGDGTAGRGTGVAHITANATADNVPSSRVARRSLNVGWQDGGTNFPPGRVQQS